MLRLAVRFEESTSYFELPSERFSLGAAPESDVHLPLPGVSRHHAEMVRQGRGVHVVDLGSKNGLMRGGQRLSELVLSPGEAVQIGKAWVRLEEVETSDAHLGLSFGERPDEPHGRLPRGAETDSILGGSEDGNARAALAWVRQAHAGALDPADPLAKPLLDAAQQVLGAESLFVLARSEAEPGLLFCSGALPDDEVLRLVEVETAPRGARAPRAPNLPSALTAVASRVVALPGERSLIAGSAGSGRSLAAVLQARPSRMGSWQRDFFEHVAEKIRPAGEAPGAEKSRRAERRPARGEQSLELPAEFVAGESVAMRGLIESLQAAACSDLDVLLLGETGTGKELVAHAVHASGPTAQGPFIAINCAAIPADLLEAELFGVEARVATGVDPRPGLFLKAEGGSLFLDEIGDMPEPLQAKLLRALQEREVLPIGSHQPKKIRVRVISASNKNLPELVRASRFRADLFYRLRGLQFHLPPLRERREDIPALVLAFATLAATRYGKHLRGVSRKALALLMAYDWPGNVRELKSEVERAALLAADGHALESEHFAPIRWAIDQHERHGDGPWERQGNGNGSGPAADRTHPPADTPAAAAIAPDERPLQERIDELERGALQQALAASRGNKSEAARRLGITRNGLALKLHRLGLE